MSYAQGSHWPSSYRTLKFQKHAFKFQFKVPTAGSWKFKGLIFAILVFAAPGFARLHVNVFQDECSWLLLLQHLGDSVKGLDRAAILMAKWREKRVVEVSQTSAVRRRMCSTAVATRIPSDKQTDNSEKPLIFFKSNISCCSEMLQKTNSVGNQIWNLLNMLPRNDLKCQKLQWSLRHEFNAGSHHNMTTCQ